MVTLVSSPPIPSPAELSETQLHRWRTIGRLFDTAKRVLDKLGRPDHRLTVQNVLAAGDQLKLLDAWFTAHGAARSVELHRKSCHTMAKRRAASGPFAHVTELFGSADCDDAAVGEMSARQRPYQPLDVADVGTSRRPGYRRRDRPTSIGSSSASDRPESTIRSFAWTASACCRQPIKFPFVLAAGVALVSLGFLPRIGWAVEDAFGRSRLRGAGMSRNLAIKPPAASNVVALGRPPAPAPARPCPNRPAALS